ncbi:TlpA disulfide reductase family protein [Halobacteriovorax sp. HLS]|uniref:TlpA family protein disulfide reductase n=1 Tax=Halobacteriovorax sp. HLS TaxID=2234000 RepID=UPI000FDAF7FA|nr:TlpA disulfide reductase family protein [Halobacteriovorax sp. HLS]
MSFSSKILIISLVIGLTLSYSMYEKKKFSSMLNVGESSPILQTMPSFQIDLVLSEGKVSQEDFKSSKATFVHFWGTWCAPCEHEFPDFLKFAKKFESDNVKFLLLAVNDDNKKIKKFLKRFKDLPSNVVIAHDSTGVSMTTFGTVKVPETYLFDSSFRNLKKFIGPQSWGMEAFAPRVRRLIFGH